MKSKQMQTNNLIVFETISLLGPKTLYLILKANICKYKKCGKFSSEFVKYENTLLLGWGGSRTVVEHGEQLQTALRKLVRHLRVRLDAHAVLRERDQEGPQELGRLRCENASFLLTVQLPVRLAQAAGSFDSQCSQHSAQRVLSQKYCEPNA